MTGTGGQSAAVPVVRDGVARQRNAIHLRCALPEPTWGIDVGGPHRLTDAEVHGEDWSEAVLVADVFGLADQAIGLMIEYRDQHGMPEEQARRSAARDIAEGASVDVAGLAAEAVQP